MVGATSTSVSTRRSLRPRRLILKIGFHISISNGFDRTLEEAKRLQCEVVQIFLKNPRSWEKKIWKDEDVAAFQRLRREVPVFGHLSYLPNLAKIDEDERNLTGFVHEVELCGEVGLDRLVIHLGSRTDKTRGIAMIAQAINYVFERYDIKLFLENSSGQGAAIGKNTEELAAVYEKIDCKEKTFICIDTAHLFEAGHNIRTKKIWNAFMDDLEARLGEDKIGFFHLNDSKTLSGSSVDRHWHIGKGEIGLGFFRSLLRNKRFAHLEGVMETPKMGNMDKENMRTMRSLLSPLMSRSLA
jgi:deoxyribonuclease IV